MNLRKLWKDTKRKNETETYYYTQESHKINKLEDIIYIVKREKKMHKMQK